MARTKASRKYQLTINNPADHGYTHERIKNTLAAMSLEYWCMCDEVGENETPHTHVYLAAKNAIQFHTVKQKFYEAHIEPAQGTHRENRDYIRKEGEKYADKKETNLPNTFEEWGELPPEREKLGSVSEEIYEMIKQGASNVDILESYPTAMNKIPHIEQVRQTLKAEEYKKAFRELTVLYYWGKTGSGKTRSIMESHGYENVYRVTNYEHPFDGYEGQDVILFDEFRSNLKIGDMLSYLDGYPLKLPCRYADRVACYTKVYVVSNVAFNELYQNIQEEQSETWNAFKRRFRGEKYFGTENKLEELNADVEVPFE
jgi:hypothetical protein